MSKPDLSTVEGVERWVMAQAEDLYHARGSDTETAAYIADAVTMYKQRLESHPGTTKRALENERLRVAFEYEMSPERRDTFIFADDFAEFLDDAMKGEDK